MGGEVSISESEKKEEERSREEVEQIPSAGGSGARRPKDRQGPMTQSVPGKFRDITKQANEVR